MLRMRNSQTLALNCIWHHLALATGQACNQVKYLKQTNEQLLALWKYFHFFTIRSVQVIQKIHNIIDSPEVKIVKGVDTCSLLRKATVAVLLCSLAAVCATLQQEVDPNAVGLCIDMTYYNFFVSLVLLNGVLSAVIRLLLVFQRSTNDLRIVPPPSPPIKFHHSNSQEAAAGISH